MSMSDDDKKRKQARDVILARRQFFIASAMAGVALGGCDRNPAVCLDVAVEPTPGSSLGPGTPSASTTVATPEPSVAPTACLDMPVEPSICLAVPMPNDSAEPAPRVCLKRAPPPPDPSPKVCLRKLPTPNDPVDG